MSDKRAESSGTESRFRFFLYDGILGMIATLMLAPKSCEESLRAEAEDLLRKANNLTWREKETIMAAIEQDRRPNREKERL
jgi:hypothetical protein